MWLRAVAVGLYGWMTVVCASGARAQAVPQQQQCTYTDEHGKVITIPDCGGQAAAQTAGPASSAGQSPAKQFPFPGETPDANAAPQQGTVSPATSPAAPAANPVDPNAPPSKRFPFPGETPSVAAPGEGLQDAGSSGSSNNRDSDSSSSSSSNNGEASSSPTDDDPAPTPRGNRRPLPAVERQSTSEREAEDISVAGFYQNDGNFRGAYERGLDAVSLDEKDPEAHLALALAARKLGKLDEAQKNFKRCLELDPLPKDRRVAEKALKEMSGNGG